MTEDQRRAAIRHLASAIGRLSAPAVFGTDPHLITSDLQGALGALGFDKLEVDENGLTASRRSRIGGTHVEKGS